MGKLYLILIPQADIFSTPLFDKAGPRIVGLKQTTKAIFYSFLINSDMGSCHLTTLLFKCIEEISRREH